jgi:hypothetical protein
MRNEPRDCMTARLHDFFFKYRKIADKSDKTVVNSDNPSREGNA